jgi:hypothetical protein
MLPGHGQLLAQPATDETQTEHGNNEIHKIASYFELSSSVFHPCFIRGYSIGGNRFDAEFLAQPAINRTRIRMPTRQDNWL